MLFIRIQLFISEWRNPFHFIQSSQTNVVETSRKWKKENIEKPARAEYITRGNPITLQRVVYRFFLSGEIGT